jgi:hypothetical protein
MLELTAPRAARDILDTCTERGLIIKLDTTERKRGGARHTILAFQT